MHSLRRAAALVLALFVLATVLVGGGVYRAFAEGDLTAADFDNSSIKMVDSSGKDLPTNAKVDFKSTFGYVWKSQSKDGVSYNGKTIKIKAPDHWIFEPSTKELNKIVDPATGVTIATIEHNADGNEITITYVTDTAFKQELKLGLMTERKDPYWANIASGDIVSPVPLKPLAEGDQYSVTVHYDAPSPVDNMFQKRSVKYDAKKKEADFIVEIRTDVANGNTVDGHEVKRNEFIFFDTPQRGMQVADGSYMNLGTYNSVGGYGPDLYPEPGDTFVPSDENGTWLHPNRKVLDDGTIIEAYRIFYDMDEKGYPIYEDKTVALKDPETAAMFESAEVASVPKNLRIEPLGTPAKPGETSGVMYRIINNHQKHFYFYGKFSVFDESYITGESGGVPTMNNKASYYAQDLTNCDSTGKCSDPLVRKSNGSSTTDVRLVTGEVQGELIYDARVKVNKVDAWGKPVPGAKFSISKYKSGLPVEDKDKKKVTNLVANAEGKLERIESDGTRTPLENIILPRTTLYLFEDEAPAGYTRMAEPLKLPIHTAETPEAAPTVTVTNEHEVGKVNVTKVDGADAPVAGAVFKLTKDAAGNEVAASYPQTDVPSVKLENLTSNAQGALEVEGKQLNTFNIETGTYYLHETSAPNNYESLTAPQKIVVTKDETNTVKVVNTRKAPKPVTISGDSGIKAQKTLNGRVFKADDSFEFVLAAKDGAPMPVAGGEKIAVTNGDPKAFGDIKFDKAGEYHYTVSETKGSAAGVTYDTTAKDVTVTVTDDNNGSLVATVAYAGGATAASFTNTYEPTPATISGESGIKAQKILDGRDFADGDSFEFVLSPKSDGAPMPEGTGNKVTVTNGTPASFGDIRFTKPGTYEYNVTETQGSAGGMTYDKTTKVVTVTVTDDGAGALSAKVSYPENASAATFTNKYTATSVELSGDTAIKAQKTLTGRDFKAGDTFEFVLSANGEAPMPAAGGEKITVTNGEPKGFGAITFTQPGTYFYNVVETKGSLPGVTYDEVVRQVEVTVTDNNTGSLNARVSYGEGETIAAFENTYKASTVTVSGDKAIKAQKVLTGREFKADDSFEFVLAAKDGAPMPEAGGEKIAVSNGEPKSFGAISFDKAGTYKYEVAETAGNIAGVTYDNTKREVTIEVTDDGSGTLKAAVSYPDNANAAKFENTYKPTGVTIGGGEPGSESAEKGINVQKVLTGREWKDSDSFTFTLEPQNGAPAFAKNSVTTTKDAKKAGFGEATFDKAGTYTYLIKETVPADAANNVKDGITYDTQTITATVTVTDDTNGKLVATTTYSTGGAVAEFTNTYGTSAATITGDSGIKAKKVLEGREFKTGDTFTFTLEAVSENAPIPAAGGEKITVINGDPKSFGAISYSTAGTYTYKVTETQGSIAGVTYDTAEKQVTVTVTDNGAGKLSASVAYPDNTDAATFTNTYTATSVTIGGGEPGSESAEKGINVQKVLTGREWKDSDSFTFTLEPQNGAPAFAKTSVTTTKDAKKAGFGEATFDKAGTYTYLIKETVPADAANNVKDGVTYDTQTITATVTVTDDTNGKLVATTTYSTGAAQAEFTNTYGATGTTLSGESGIQVKKKLTGREWSDGDSFTFTLTPKDEAPAFSKTSVEVTNGNVANFGTASFATVGTYTYEIAETAGDIAGVTYDTNKITATVTVADNGQGQLTASVAYSTGADVAEFTNTYAATSATLTGDNAIKAQKKLEGRAFKADDSFEFVLSAKDGAPMPAAGGEKITVSNGDPKAFGDIKFDKAGEYKYEVRETAGSAAGITYDSSAQEVTVTVIDTGKGTLEASVAYADETAHAATFTNTYKASATTITGADAIKAQKVLEGRSFKADDSFEFVLSAVDGAPMPASGGEKIIVTNGEAKSFGAISFDKAGAYTYNVSETAGSAAGITYDTTTKQVTVTVTDDGAGKLAAKVSYGADGVSAATFTNKYKATSVTIGGGEPGSEETNSGINVKKNLVGRSWKTGDSFTFTLEPQNGAPAFAKNSVEVTSAEPANFGSATFEQAGTYTYKIAETQGNIPGVTYATDSITATVTVTDDGSGKLAASVAYSTGAAQAEFTNTYAAGAATLSGDTAIKAQKKLSGRAFKADDSFEFVLTAKDNAPMPATGGEKLTVNNGEPKGFGAISYTTAGTYKYEVAETQGSAGGVTYSTEVREVVVTVTDDGSGALKAEVSYPEGASAAQFKNTYTTTTVTIGGGEPGSESAEKGINVQKVLTGREWKDTDSFTFTLEPQAGAPAFANTSATATKDAKKVGFGAATFEAAGTYTYLIKETVPAEAANNVKDGVTYDTQTITATVTVADDTNGHLVATTTYSTGGSVAEFKNTYTAGAATLTGDKAIKAQKVLTGREFKADDSFEFVLTAKDNAPMPAAGGEKITVTNGDPKSFGALSYTKAGTYKYEVAETKGSAGGVTYDENKREVVVNVTDDGNGALSATVSYPEGTQAATFTNTYEAAEVELSADANNLIRVQKTLTGRAWKQGDSFTFTATPQNGAPALSTSSVTVTNDQPAAFGRATYTKAGTYTYEIAETAGNIGGIAYDTNKITAKVTVEDNGEGKLVATTTYSTGSDKAEFVNTYGAGAATITGDSGIKAKKTLTGREFKTGDSFEFVLTAKDNAPMPAAGGDKITVSNGDPKSFGAISYTKAGAYKYEVRESAGTVPGVTYSDAVREVTVTVTDNGEGNLVAEVSGTAEFTNTYKAAEVELSADANNLIRAQKVLVGRDFKAGDTFTFTATPQNGAPALEKASVTVTNGEVADFGKATYVQAGTYTYEIAETAGAIPGVTYDTNKIIATVTVADNGEGKLVATTTYSTGGAQAEFKNTYTAGAATLTGDKAIKAQKVLSGRAFKADDSFEFVLTAKDNAPMPEAGGEKITVNNGEPKSFGAISFDKAGTYKYEVKETQGTIAGVTYSTEVREVVVNVTDDGNGLLAAEVVYPNNASAATFTNTYTATSVTIGGGEPGSESAEKGINVQKVLTGREWKDSDSFTFTLEPQAGAPAFAKTSVTATKDAKKVGFGAATFDKAGTYTYKIAETAGTLGGITYDTNKITATVTVADDTNGHLVATTTYSNNASVATFTNTYTAGAATITGDSGIKVKKVLTGRDFKAGDAFEFVLSAKDGAPMPEAGGEKLTISSAEPKSFGSINYTQAGTYKYEVRETQGTTPGVTYDTSAKEITVTVTDDGNGALVAEVSGVAEFENTYTVAAATLDAEHGLRVQKTLEGREWYHTDAFEFVVEPVDGAPVPQKTRITATNTEVISFGAMQFDHAGTYLYRISEVAGTEAGMTYDTMVVTARVEVIDDTEGHLLATVSYSNGTATAEFVNTYTEPRAPEGDNDGNGNNNGGRRTSRKLPAAGDATGIAALITGAAGLVVATLGRVTKRCK